MKHRFTKFQSETWTKIQNIIKNRSYKVEFNHDDEFVITQEMNGNTYVTTIFPKKEISLIIHYGTGKNEVIFFNTDNIDNFLVEFDKKIS